MGAGINWHRVTKEMTFDCAHLLSGHEGLCANLHGHTYKIQVELEGPLYEDGPERGMVVDFSNLKEWMRDIVGPFDHAFIYEPNGGHVEQEIAAVLLRNKMRTVWLPYRPTAENMAKYFYHAFEKQVKFTSLRVSCIRLWETPTSFAEYRG